MKGTIAPSTKKAHRHQGDPALCITEHAVGSPEAKTAVWVG